MWRKVLSAPSSSVPSRRNILSVDHYCRTLTLNPTHPALLCCSNNYAVSRRNFHRFSKKIDPRGRAVFISGCDTGFGYDLSLRLRDYGFHVFSGCLASESNGGRKLHSLEKEGRMKVLQCDVTKWNEVLHSSELVAQHISDENLELWAIISNAGVCVFSEFEWVPLEQYENMMDVNCMGSIRVVKAFLPLLREARGRLIIMASLAGRYVVPGFTAYSMTKHAQVALGDGLRRELRKFGITVSTIEPASYKTQLADTTNVVHQLDRCWKEIPPSVQHAYGWYYLEALKVHMTKLAGTASPHVNEPVDVTVEAVTSSRIKPRYMAASQAARVRGIFVPWLSTALQDFVFRRYSLELPKKK